MSDLQPGATFGRWTLLRLLGSGGMGEVHLARDDAVGREVALKVLRHAHGERARERFLREGLAASRVRHAALIDVHEAGEIAGRPFLIMDRVEGESLAERLVRTRRQPFPPREAATLIATLARGVAALHGAGVLHRDIKPSNVLLDAASRPRLVDLGVAHLADLEPLTLTGQMVGTPLYMAPEQFEGAEPDERADVYGLGCLLFELLSGTSPFPHGASLPLLRANKQRRPRRASELARGLDRDLVEICARAMEPEPSGRFASAASLADALETWLGGGGPSLRRRHALRALLAVLLLVALARFAGPALWSSDRPHDLDLSAWRRELETTARRAPRLSRVDLDARRVAALERLGSSDEAGPVWAWVGLVALSRGERARAEEALARAKGPAADLLRGGLLADTSPREAVAALESASRSGLDLAELHAWRIRALLATGLVDREAADTGLASSRRPDAAALDPERALALEASCLFFLGRREEGERIADRLRDPPATLRWERALAVAQTELAARGAEAALRAFERERAGLSRPFPPRQRERDFGRVLLDQALSLILANGSAYRGPTGEEAGRVETALRLRCEVLPEEPGTKAQRDALLDSIEDYHLLINEINHHIDEYSAALLRLWRDDPELHVRLARMFLTGIALAPWRRALEIARRAVQLSPSREARAVLARALAANEEWEEASQVAEGVLSEAVPRDWLADEAELIVAVRERVANGPRSALPRLRSLAARELPDELASEVSWETWRTLRQLGGPEALEAALAFRGGPSLRKFDERAVENVYAILCQAGRWAECQALMEPFRQIGRPRGARWSLYLAHALAKQGGFDEALAVLALIPNVVTWEVQSRLRAGDADALDAAVEYSLAAPR